jgi:DNA recombination protein RmuC
MSILILSGLVLSILVFLVLIPIIKQKYLQTLQDSFKSISLDLMERNNRSFLQLAELQLNQWKEKASHDLDLKQKSIESLFDPLKHVIEQLKTQNHEVEKKREGAYSALLKQIEWMMHSDKELRHETAQLSKALRSPNARGSWGQIHLKKVMEIAGLVEYCDFQEQVSLDGGSKRPDVVVHLPGNKKIIIDAKTPFDAFIEAQQLEEPALRQQKIKEHTQALRKHIRDLSSKEYWKSLDITPEFVILFLPAESIFSAALQADPALIEVGAKEQVILATPTTLIAVLRSIASAWKQERLSSKATEIAELGIELYERVSVLLDHWNRLGKQLSTAVETYNQTVSSLESRVLVTARKLKEASGVSQEIIEPKSIDQITSSCIKK